MRNWRIERSIIIRRSMIMVSPVASKPYGYDGEKSFTGESLSLDEFNTRYPDADMVIREKKN